MASFDSTWGGSLSTAYLSITAANTIAAEISINPSNWTSATTVQKGAALVQASETIDSRQYVGQREFSYQMLEFPRAAVDPDATRMRRDVEEACTLQAIWLLKNSGSNAHLERRALGIKRYREVTGPISEETEYQRGGGITRLTEESLSRLSRWMTTRRIRRA